MEEALGHFLPSARLGELPNSPEDIWPQARPGRAFLAVQRVDGQSSVTARFATSPLQLLAPRSRGGTVWACTSSLGGGLVAGDETFLRIDLSAGTRCVLGTQSSTKIYRNPEAKPCGHRTVAHLGRGAFLALLPDPVQPFAQALYTQRQSFHLEEGASLVLVDWLTSGRAARGERWAFTRVETCNQVLLNGRQLLMDALRLDSEDGPLENPYRLGRFNCLALLLVMGDSLREAAFRVLADVTAQPLRRHATLYQSASPLEPGAIVRLAGESVMDVGRELRRHLALLGVLDEPDHPWVRKW
jgi:urease accessory protein